MSKLFFVRHGQASFMTADYDQLSDLGVEQGRQLGLWWARHGVPPDQVHCGPLRRHRGTMQAFLEAIREGGGVSISSDGIVECPELDEYPAQQVFLAGLPQLVEEEPEIGVWLQQWQQGDETARRSFQQIFSRLVSRFVRGEFSLSDGMTWAQFRERVLLYRDRLSLLSAGQTVLTFSSGGPMMVLAGAAIGLSDEDSLALGWRLRNGAWSEFQFSQKRLALTSYNCHPHLVGAELISYR